MKGETRTSWTSISRNSDNCAEGEIVGQSRAGTRRTGGRGLPKRTLDSILSTSYGQLSTSKHTERRRDVLIPTAHLFQSSAQGDREPFEFAFGGEGDPELVGLFVDGGDYQDHLDTNRDRT